MLWTPRPNAMYERRVALGLTREKLADATSLAVGTLRRIERGQRVRNETLDLIAKELDVTREYLADPPEAAKAPAKKQQRTADSPAKPTAVSPPATQKVPLRAEDLSPVSRLATLIAREEKAGIDPPLRFGNDDVPPLTVRATRSIYTSFKLRGGRRYYVRGHIVDQRGLPPAEADHLGSENGVGARFHLVRRLDDEATFGVTVHSVDPAITDALLDAHESVEVRLVVDVKIAAGFAPAFASFSTVNPHPWTLVAAAIVPDHQPSQRASKRR